MLALGVTILDWCQSLRGVLKVSNLARGVHLREMFNHKEMLSSGGVHLIELSIIKRCYLLGVSSLEGGVHLRGLSIIKRCLSSGGVQFRGRCTS